MALELSSSAIAAGSTIPTVYTCDGENVSPPLSWRGASPETKSFALIVDDPDAPSGLFTHWVVYNIPSSVHELPVDMPVDSDLPQGGIQGRNSFGHQGYDGPCPPPGPEHHYYFRLFALDRELDLPPSATRNVLINAMRNHIIASAELITRYARSK